MTPAKLQALGERIRAALTDDLLRPEWRSAPRRSPTAGHCYVATEAMYHAIGGKASGFKPVSGRCPGGVHWWLEAPDGTVVDLTWDQFTKKELQQVYAAGRGCGFLTSQPSKRAQVVLKRIGKSAQKNPVEAREAGTALYRSVSPWEMAEILRTGVIEGRAGWFSSDPRRGSMRTWFGEKVHDVAHNGEDWHRAVTSGDPFLMLTEQAHRLDVVAKAAKKGGRSAEKVRFAAEDLAEKLRKKRDDEVGKILEALEPQRDALRATSYIVEVDFLMPGGTRYTGKDSLAFGAEVGFPEGVPYADAATVFLVHTVKPRHLPLDTPREDVIDERRGWKVVDNVNPQDVRVELPKIPAKSIVSADTLAQKSEPKVRDLEAKAGVTVGGEAGAGASDAVADPFARANANPPGGFNEVSERDLADAVEYLGGHWDQPLSEGDLKFVGFEMVDPEAFIDDPIHLEGDRGWLTQPEAQAQLEADGIRAFYTELGSRDMTRTYEMWRSGALSPAIQVDGEMGDGRGRAMLAWALGVDVPVAKFKTKRLARRNGEPAATSPYRQKTGRPCGYAQVHDAVVERLRETGAQPAWLADFSAHHCAQADREHEESERQHCHVGHLPGKVCYASAADGLPLEHQLGLVLHEFGHLCLQGKDMSIPWKWNEQDASDAGGRLVGVQVPFRGRLTLEWARPPRWLLSKLGVA